MPDVETPSHATKEHSTRRRPHRPGRRKQSAPAHVYVAAYDSTAEAHADHKLLRKLKRAGRVEAYDAALVFRDDHGRLHVHKRERATRRSTWTGIAVGHHCATLHNKAVSPHTLRHTAAMNLLHAGVDSTVIALWLGHESIEATQIYLHADMQIKERALARTTPPDAKPGRYRPPDTLLAFLEAL